jgi:uncharacterized membrane protein YeaQ/YmgE (transglycosylase-associated protein family)
VRSIYSMLSLAWASLRRRLGREQLLPALIGLGIALVLGLLDRALDADGRAGAAGITSAVLGAIIALTVYKSIGRK